MFIINDDLKKIKTKVLVFSGISLFISLTQSLPQKVGVLGLDLSKNETMAGWFVFAVAGYFLINFIVFSIMEIIRYYLPYLIGQNTANTTGETIGLTVGECFPDYGCDEPIAGTVSGEIQEINIKNERITYEYKRNFINFSNMVRLINDFLFPVVFGIVSLVFLYLFLISIQ